MTLLSKSSSGRIDNDTLSETKADQILAAYQGDDALAQALGGDPRERPARVRGPGERREPVGAFVRSITADGFRGIGPAVTLVPVACPRIDGGRRAQWLREVELRLIRMPVSKDEDCTALRAVVGRRHRQAKPICRTHVYGAMTSI